MKNLHRCQRMLRFSAAVAIVLIAAGAESRAAHKSGAWANTQFATAVHLQEALESQPVAERTRRDYQRVISAYQRVYDESPTASKADPSVMASAELLEEMGRQFKDTQVLQSAIERYQFLRDQYPGSKARFDALFRIAEIYRDDLFDRAKAEATFQEFLKRYPGNPLAAEAKRELAEPVQLAATNKRAPIGPPRAAKPANTESDDSADASANDDSAKSSNPDDSNRASVNRVLGIRHWSTPDYTRVAIDLEQSVKYQAQRIENPDRIFFDLYGTRLDRALYGKSFDVDDGFLKKIRVAQFKSERTRVVLDLDELTDYRATLQTNPPRLIIDIRNKRLGSNGSEKQLIATSEDASQDVAPGHAPAAKPAVTVKRTAAPDTHSDCDSPDCGDASPAANSTPANSPTVRRTSLQPAKRVVVGKDGVKKTIVDADADATPITKLDAKLDPPTLPPVPANEPDDSASPKPVKPRSAKSKRSPPPDDLETREAQPTANGDRSLIRALGLKIGKIVIDPGHGGHDTGTVGPNGLEEKDLVLDVSLRLGKLLSSRLGAQVIYTRKDDTFIPLEDRTAIANQEGADLFVSVHANSSHDEDARGVETYYLNFTSSPEALEVAARENAVSEKSIHELQDILRKIALKEKIEESHEFASDVQNSLYSGLAAKSPGLRNRGVKKAPFIVLIGANMPSILAEISFVSNPGDERKLKTPEYRQKIAESLYRGVSKYVSGLSGVKVASKIDKGEGQ